MKTAVCALTAATILFLSSNALGAEYEVPESHPRIFIFAEDLPALAKSCSPGGMHAEDYRTLKDYVDHESEVLNHSAMSFAFVSLIEKQSGRPADKYIALLKKHILGMAEGDMIEANKWHYYQSLIAAEWIWDAFTPAERGQLARGMKVAEAGSWPYKYYHENVPSWRLGPTRRASAMPPSPRCRRAGSSLSGRGWVWMPGGGPAPSAR
jgi:hypothetical protein